MRARFCANYNPFGKADVFEWGVEEIKAHGCSGFSDYVQQLIRDDKKHRRKLEPPLMIERVARTTISIDENILRTGEKRRIAMREPPELA